MIVDEPDQFPGCSDCSRAKFDKHSYRCEPCVMKALSAKDAEIAALKQENEGMGQEIEAANEEIERWKITSEDIAASNRDLIDAMDRREEVLKEQAKEIKLLRSFAQHKCDCEWRNNYRLDKCCTCGLAACLAKYESASKGGDDEPTEGEARGR